MNNFLDILTHHDVATIDLHEYEDISDALFFLDREMYRMYKNGVQHVRVIHGVGRGVMKDAVHQTLLANPLVHDFFLEQSLGSTLVQLS